MRPPASAFPTVGGQARIAEFGNVTGVVEVMAAALPCQECHDDYRTLKKKPAA